MNTGMDDGSQQGPPIVYRLEKDGYRVTVTTAALGATHIDARDLQAAPPGGPIDPVEVDFLLPEPTLRELKDLVNRVRSAATPALPGGQNASATVEHDGWSAQWNDESLKAHASGKALRKFMESECMLTLQASQLAAARAERFEEHGQVEDHAKALQQAVECLERWWKPEGPVRDETGTRFIDGKGALRDGDFPYAIMRFQRVLSMRTENYKKKYEKAAAAGGAD